MIIAAGANKSAKRQFREVLAKAKTYDGIAEHIGGIDGGEGVLESVSLALAGRDEIQEVLEDPPAELASRDAPILERLSHSPRATVHELFEAEGAALIAV